MPRVVSIPGKFRIEICVNQRTPALDKNYKLFTAITRRSLKITSVWNRVPGSLSNFLRNMEFLNIHEGLTSQERNES